MHIYVIKYICLKSQENYNTFSELWGSWRTTETKSYKEIQKYDNRLTVQLGGGSLEHVLFWLCFSAYLYVRYNLSYVSNNQQIKKTEIQPIKMNCVESQTSNQ